jgi:hypothetical protein
MIIRGLVHIDASILGHDKATTEPDGGMRRNGSRVARITHPFHPTSKAGGDPGFAMKLQRMGHPVLFRFCFVFVSILFRLLFRLLFRFG